MPHNSENNQKNVPVNEPNGTETPENGDRTSDRRVRAAPAYGHRIDAVVLSGTHRNEKRLIQGRNKAFLDIGDSPLVRHVVDALVGAEQIDRIFVVGPVDELEVALEGCPRVHLVPQKGKMLSNGWAAIRASEEHQRELGCEAPELRPLMVISCDLPLISPVGIDDFVIRCARVDAEEGVANAMLVGVAEDAGLSPYYGSEAAQGIERPLVQLTGCQVRLANIYVARPRLMSHSEYLQTSFSYRKAIDWRNVARLVCSMFSQQGGWAAAWLTVRLQIAGMLKKGDGRLYYWLRKGNTAARVERAVSTVLGGPVRIVITPYGGLSLDVDDEEDYTLLSARYAEWTGINEAVDPESVPGGASSDQGQR